VPGPSLPPRPAQPTASIDWQLKVRDSADKIGAGTLKLRP
jgi:hypothetical protein